MEIKVKVVSFLTILALIFFGMTVWVFHEIIAKFEPQTIHLWAAIMTAAFLFGIPVISMIGFYFGKVEARGFLQGADQMMERGFSRLVDVVNVRDTSRVNVRNAAPEVPPTTQPVYLFPGQGPAQLYHHDATQNQRGGVVDIE